MEILQLKNSMNEMKNAIERVNRRTDQTEERISELEDRNFEITQPEEKNNNKNLRVKNWVLHATDKSLNSTPDTNNTLYVN